MNEKNEVAVYNKNGQLVTKPFIFTYSGSVDFYGSPNKITLVKTSAVDDRSKSFYFCLTKDEEKNYELNLRFNPTNIIQSVTGLVAIGNGIKSFFSN